MATGNGQNGLIKRMSGISGQDLGQYVSMYARKGEETRSIKRSFRLTATNFQTLEKAKGILDVSESDIVNSFLSLLTEFVREHEQELHEQGVAAE